MAVNVDRVYQTVLALANKEQRGYITPQEFNLLAHKAQMDIFESYFSEIRAAKREAVRDVEFGRKIRTIQDKMNIFKVYKSRSLIAGNSGQSWEFNVPSNVYSLGSVFYTPITNSALAGYGRSDILVTEVGTEDIHHMMRSPLTRPNKERPVYVRATHTSTDQQVTMGERETIRIYPPNDWNASSTWPHFSTTTTTEVDSGEEDEEGNPIMSTVTTLGTIAINYIVKPNQPKWGYVVVNSKPLYNANASVNFELHESEESSLTNKILELAGISMKKPDVAELILRNEQMKEAIKNK